MLLKNMHTALISLEIILTVNAFYELYNDNPFDISSIFEDSEDLNPIGSVQENE